MQLEVKHIDNTLALLGSLGQHVKSFSGSLAYLEHKDIGVNNFLNKTKKLVTQEFDLHSMIEHQLLLLKNEVNSFNIREKYKLEREERMKKLEDGKIKRRMV
jgi:hypothetical protein